MGIGSGSNFWAEMKGSMLTVTLKQAKNIIMTDRSDPCVAIDAMLQFVMSYKACWTTKAKYGTITSFESIINSSVDKCLALDMKFKELGYRTIWCLEGDKNVNKLATGRRREDTIEIQERIIRLYLSIISLKTIHGDNDLSAFKRKYALIEENIPENFDRTQLIDDRLEEMENRLSIDFRNTGYFPPNFSKLMIDGMNSSKSKPMLFRVPEISEGEKLCCILTQTGVAQAVYSTDGDTVVYGARFVLRPVFKAQREISVNEFELYSYSRIVRQNGFTYDDLLKFSILLGNDFNDKVYGDGVVKCRSYLKDSSFDIIQHNIKNLGRLNIATCLREMTISKEEYDLVMKQIASMC